MMGNRIVILAEVFVHDVSALGFTIKNLHTRRLKEVGLKLILQGKDKSYQDEPGKYQILPPVLNFN